MTPSSRQSLRRPSTKGGSRERHHDRHLRGDHRPHPRDHGVGSAAHPHGDRFLRGRQGSYGRTKRLPPGRGPVPGPPLPPLPPASPPLPPSPCPPPPFPHCPDPP